MLYFLPSEKVDQTEPSVDFCHKYFVAPVKSVVFKFPFEYTYNEAKSEKSFSFTVFLCALISGASTSEFIFEQSTSEYVAAEEPL
ncbi:MAG: hypothetical protein BWY47_01565 [Bacteroidetes bacterium ADurb.Bin302]|nr:MAG: hypothetical protein BWY47_01565 [Bacteroidetes bacterium ADurb.Bin302]